MEASSTAVEAAAAVATAAATAAMTAATAASAGQLHAATTNVFPVEEMEGGQTDVGHFLFAENEALIGRSSIGWLDIGSRQCRRRCATHQRKTQSGGTERRHRGDFGCAFLLRSLLDPWHGLHPL
jgi:hypothetical protein